ncbi:OmpA family protein [Lacibacter sp.]|uniref:OmpA family protein n=1 Tax=Lacibacter sp. TaxID=1915409 RepID=UPI002B4AD9BF|nr:OmpA family protein [Lacibacter sp.]HLP37778.1 OmpA family protein [Lacibacter sp.]
MRKTTKIVYYLLTVSIVLAACKGMTKTQKGAIIGTTGGAAVGAVIGRASGNTALGTIIGAAVGGTAGVLIGKKMDKQAEEIKKQVPNAKVERVGEGINIEFESKVLFDYDQSGLKTEAKTSLNEFVTILKKFPDTNIEIQGHTDNKGSDAYNDALSQRRANAVMVYLIDRGIANSRMNPRAMGENHPKYTNETEEGRAQNRRVEFLITANEKMKSDAKKEAGSGQ